MRNLRYALEDTWAMLVLLTKIALGKREPVQGFRVRKVLEEAGLTHDLEVKADLRGVLVYHGEVAYCPAKIEITEIVSTGDGEPLHEFVTAPTGLPRFLKQGKYDVLGATIRANGRIKVSAENAEVILVEAHE